MNDPQDLEYLNMLDLLHRQFLIVRIGDTDPVKAFYHMPDSVQGFHWVRLPTEPNATGINSVRVHVNQIQVQKQGNVL